MTGDDGGADAVVDSAAGACDDEHVDSVGDGDWVAKCMMIEMTMMWTKLGEWSLNCLIDSSPLNSHWPM